MTTYLIRFLEFTFLTVISISSCSAGQQRLSRSDCIVEVRSNNPGATKFETTGLEGLMKKAFDLHLPLAGYRVQNEKFVYLQYSSMCDRKTSITKTLLSAIYAEKDFSVSESVVAPGAKTIDLWGKYWRDKGTKG